MGPSRCAPHPSSGGALHTMDDAAAAWFACFPQGSFITHCLLSQMSLGAGGRLGCATLLKGSHPLQPRIPSRSATAVDLLWQRIHGWRLGQRCSPRGQGALSSKRCPPRHTFRFARITQATAKLAPKHQIFSLVRHLKAAVRVYCRLFFCSGASASAFITPLTRV